MTRTPTSPNGTPIAIRPIGPGELDHIPLRCWPERETLDRLFAEQGTLGMAAWEGDRCVAQLHGYCVLLPDGDNPHWPGWNRWWTEPDWAKAVLKARSVFSGPAWCHACIHVGRTSESSREEVRALVLRLIPRIGRAPAKIVDALKKLHVHHVGPSMVEEMLAQSGSSECAEGAPWGADPRYFGHGIGTALCETSVGWARGHGYVAVLASGAPDRLFAFAVLAGALPWTTYAKLGFETIGFEAEGQELPAWAQGSLPPEVKVQLEAALAAGRPTSEIQCRLMGLKLAP